MEEWKTQLERTPICSYRDCIATFTGMEELKDHFEEKHQADDDHQLNLEICVKKCQKCLVGPFQNFEDLLWHSARKHSTIGKKALKILYQFLVNTGCVL